MQIIWIKGILLPKTGFIYLDEAGVDVVCVIFGCDESELYSAVVNWMERNM